jgi:hypothetical protein
MVDPPAAFGHPYDDANGSQGESSAAQKSAEWHNGMIFVFGSNLAGRHCKGAALHAIRYFGAVYGKGIGFQGQSYALPTYDPGFLILPLDDIRKHVAEFLGFAHSRPDLEFWITPIGCGLPGYRPEQIAPMFTQAPGNCRLPPEFLLE